MLKMLAVVGSVVYFAYGFMNANMKQMYRVTDLGVAYVKNCEEAQMHLPATEKVDCEHKRVTEHVVDTSHFHINAALIAAFELAHAWVIILGLFSIYRWARRGFRWEAP